MKQIRLELKLLSLSLSGIILFSSCSSTTMIYSNPTNAKLYLNEELVGETPYKHKDSKIVGSTNTMKLEKEGYITVNTTFSKDEEIDVGAMIGGIFFLVPFLWVMKYKPARTVELRTLEPEMTTVKQMDQSTNSKSSRILELKKLLDENLISAEEFEIEKKKIVEDK